MPSILVAYATGQGQTAKVAEYVDSVLSERHDVTTEPIADIDDASVQDFDAVLVGSSVNNRRHQPEAIAFVERNREVLASRPSGFFQLSFASAIPFQWGRQGAMEFLQSLVDETDWYPDQVGLFAGAVKYTQYDRPTRYFFRLFSAITSLGTDTSRDYEYTDWDDVERFAVEFADFVDEECADTSVVATLGGGVVLQGRRRAALLAVLGVGLLGVGYWIARRCGYPCWASAVEIEDQTRSGATNDRETGR